MSLHLKTEAVFAAYLIRSTALSGRGLGVTKGLDDQERAVDGVSAYATGGDQHELERLGNQINNVTITLRTSADSEDPAQVNDRRADHAENVEALNAALIIDNLARELNTNAIEDGVEWSVFHPTVHTGGQSTVEGRWFVTTWEFTCHVVGCVIEDAA